MIVPRITIDATGLNRGLKLASEFTKRTPAEAVNSAALEVAYNAKYNMPFVPVDRIDAQLGTIVTPVIGKRGKPLSIKYAKNRIYAGSAMGREVPTVPLAVLIIQARARPGSNYNELTNNRYALSASPFKGVSRALGRAAMASAVNIMIRLRRPSGGFLMAGWTKVINKMLPFTKNRWRIKPPPSNEATDHYYGADLGDAQPAREGGTQAICIIENLVGMEGQNSNNFNQALHTYGAPALQRALDGEGAKQMQYYLDKAGKSELEGPVNAAWK